MKKNFHVFSMVLMAFQVFFQINLCAMQDPEDEQPGYSGAQTSQAPQAPCGQKRQLDSSLSGEEAPGHKNAGLINGGLNICYLNSVVQCLSNLKAFRATLLAREKVYQEGPLEKPLVFNLIKLFKDLRTTDESAIQNYAFVGLVDKLIKEIKANRGKLLQDADEFLTLLLTQINEPDKISLELQLGQTTECVGTDTVKGCGHKSSAPNVTQVKTEVDLLKSTTPKNLSDLLQNHFTAHPESYECGRCRESNTSFTSSKILENHDELIITLKRFNLDGTKISTPVSFPMELDLKPYAANPLKERAGVNLLYELVGFVCHGSNHYISFVKDFENGAWSQYDDSQVTPQNASYVQDIASSRTVLGNFTPYILFYQKKEQTAQAPTQPAAQQSGAEYEAKGFNPNDDDADLPEPVRQRRRNEDDPQNPQAATNSAGSLPSMQQSHGQSSRGFFGGAYDWLTENSKKNVDSMGQKAQEKPKVAQRHPENQDILLDELDTNLQEFISYLFTKSEQEFDALINKYLKEYEILISEYMETSNGLDIFKEDVSDKFLNLRHRFASKIRQIFVTRKLFLKKFPQRSWNDYERLKKGEKDLEFADLEGADLSNLNLSGVCLNGANLRNTNLNNTNFTKTKLFGTDFKGAKFVETNLNDAHCIFTDFRGATFEGNVKFEEAKFIGCEFSNSNFSNKLTINKALFLSSNAQNCTLSDIVFNETYLIGLNFSKSIFTDIHFKRSHLIKVDFSHSEKKNDLFIKDLSIDNCFVDGLNFGYSDIENLRFLNPVKENELYQLGKNVSFERATLSQCRFIGKSSKELRGEDVHCMAKAVGEKATNTEKMCLLLDSILNISGIDIYSKCKEVCCFATNWNFTNTSMNESDFKNVIFFGSHFDLTCAESCIFEGFYSFVSNTSNTTNYSIDRSEEVIKELKDLGAKVNGNVGEAWKEWWKDPQNQRPGLGELAAEHGVCAVAGKYADKLVDKLPWPCVIQ